MRSLSTTMTTFVATLPELSTRRPALIALVAAEATVADRTTPAAAAITRFMSRLFPTGFNRPRINFFPLAAGPHPRRVPSLMPRLGFAVLGSAWPQALFHWRR